MTSIAFSLAQERISAGRKASLTNRLVGVFIAIAREIRLRRDLRNLQRLDDAMLRDIGLGRGELEDVVRHGRSGLHSGERLLHRRRTAQEFRACDQNGSNGD